MQPQAGSAGGWGPRCVTSQCSFCRWAPEVPPEPGHPHRRGEAIWARGTAGLRPISMPGMVGFCVSGDINIKSMGCG